MVNNYFNITRLRTSLLFLCSMLVTLTSVAQTTFNFDATAPGYVAAGDDRHPLGCYFGYERSQFIYTAAELGNLPVGSIIDSVGFFLTTYNVPPELDYDFKIYVREVGSPTVTGSAFAPLAGASVLRFTSPPPMNHNNLGACGLSGPLNRWITTYLNLGTSQITSGSNLEFLVEDNWGSSAGTSFDPNGWFINNSICGAGAGVGFFNSIMFAQNNKTASGQYWNADNNPPSFNGFATNFRPNIHIVSHLAPPCVGVPAAGVIQATTSANPVCGSPFSLGLTGVPGASGFTFQWDSSTTSAAGPWGPIAGATQAFYTATQSTTTWYRCLVSCGAATVYSTVIQVNQNPLFNCYCGPNTGIILQGVSCNSAFINTVNINGYPSALNNANTGCTSGNGQAYTLYPFSTPTTTTVRQGQTYTLSITTGGSSQSISVYIDWNHDGDFSDAGEWYGLTGSPPQVLGAGTYTMPVTVPSGIGASPFNTGMRVRSRVVGGSSNDATTPCLEYFSGETEDYAITVDPVVLPLCNASTLTSAVNSRSPLGTVCSGQALTLKVNPDPSLGYQGWTYQWRYDSSGGTWNNLGGLSPSTIVTGQSRYTRYTCKICCPSNSTCIPSDTLLVPVKPATWLGHNPNTSLPSNNWFDGANWCGRVPTAVDSVLIDKSQSSNPYYCPVVGGGDTARAYQLTVAFGDSLTVKTDNKNSLSVAHDIINFGYIDINSTKADSVAFSPGGATTGIFTPFSGSFIREERSQLMYDSTELASSGMLANDVIDTLYFHIYSRSSTNPYPNFRIWYGLTSDLVFPSTTPYSGLTLVYSNPALSLATMVPGTIPARGTMALPVTLSPLTWDGKSSIVIQICWDTPGGVFPGAKDFVYVTNTLNTVPPRPRRCYLQLLTGSSTGNGCAIVPGGSVTASFMPSETRPNITFRFHRPQTVMTAALGTLAGGGGFNNNGNGSRLFVSNSNFTINGNVLNDGIIGTDTANIFIVPSAGNTGDLINGGTLNLGYTPVLTTRKSQVYFSGTNWTNNGIMTPGSKSRVVFAGAINQTIGGINPSTFNDFRMEKAAVGQSITLNRPIIINDTLVLNNGKLLMNRNSITLTDSIDQAIRRLPATSYNNSPNGGVIVNEDTTTAVNWAIRSTTTAHSIPFADVSTNHVIPVVIINSGATDLGTVSVITYPTPAANTPYPNGVNHVNSTLGANNSANTVDRFWVVSKTGPGNGPTTLAFSFGDGERPVAMSSTGPVQGKAQPWGAAGGWRIAPNSASQTMLALGGTGCLALPNGCTQRVSQVVVPTYAWTYGNSSPWAIANASSPLPIKLISFDAKAIDDHTKINWVTASEENNDYFTVQRTNDFNTMVDIAKIPTQNGNSNQIQYYETYDQHPIKGINYYRLLQTDMGGVAEPASDYVAVRFGVKSTFDILFISTENQVEVNFEYDSELPLNYTVSDMLGKTIASGANNAASPGVNLLKLDASAWPHGMYLITLQNKEKSVTRKMVY